MTARQKSAARSRMPSVADLRRQAKDLIDVLEFDSLQAAVKFLAFLEEEDCDAATKEAEQIPGLLGKHERALKALAAGRKGVDWRKVRNDV